jgi:ATP-binding cassette subfamily B protein
MNVTPLSVGEVMMYSGAFAQALQSVRQGVEYISGIYEDMLFIAGLVEFHKLEPRLHIERRAQSVPDEIESVEVRNVSFRYPGSQCDVLRNVSITFTKSASTLLVGHNGAGKTTLIKLLMRLYDPDEGSILINGTDIRGFDIKTLHRAVGVMFQEYARFAVSAAENIGYGCVENLADHSRICEAARRAKAYEFINRLPYEFDTVLSRLFRDGHELSLGQWQRICLARLFMKDPPIMIFDEPTASLDIETEVHLLNEIARLAQDRICVLVSHRMFRHDIAEQIVILKDGQVVEQGRYEDLVNRDGEFARLHRLYHGTAQNHAGENAEGTTATPILSH